MSACGPQPPKPEWNCCVEEPGVDYPKFMQETANERPLNRTLDRLERLQRLQKGDYVPVP